MRGNTWITHYQGRVAVQFGRLDQKISPTANAVSGGLGPSYRMQLRVEGFERRQKVWRPNTFGQHACSNQDLALSERTCRLHTSASQTFASGKFSVFIDLFGRQVCFCALGNDERELHPLRTRALALQQNALDPRQNQFADGVACRRSLLLSLPV